MTVDEIKIQVKIIGEVAGDAEVAHAYEDQLHQTVLRNIAEGMCEDPTGCAAAALLTNEFDFPRWCA